MNQAQYYRRPQGPNKFHYYELRGAAMVEINFLNARPIVSTYAQGPAVGGPVCIREVGEPITRADWQQAWETATANPECEFREY